MPGLLSELSPSVTVATQPGLSPHSPQVPCCDKSSEGQAAYWMLSSKGLKLDHDLCTSLDWLKFTLCVQENTDTPRYKFQLYQVPPVTSDDLSFQGFIPRTHRKRTLLIWEIIC